MIGQRLFMYKHTGGRQQELRAAQTGEAAIKRGPTVPPAVRREPVGSRRASGGPVGTPWRAQGVLLDCLHLAR